MLKVTLRYNLNGPDSVLKKWFLAGSCSAEHKTQFTPHEVRNTYTGH